MKLTTRTLEDCLREEAIRKEEKEARVRRIVEERRRLKMLGVPERELRALSERILEVFRHSTGLISGEISVRLDSPPGLCRKARLRLEAEGRISREGKGVRKDPFRWKISSLV